MTEKVRTKSISNGQIGQITDRLTTKLRESGLPFDEVQQVLMAPGGAAIDDMAATFRKHVEAMTGRIIAPNGVIMPEGTVVRHVRIDGTRTPREVVDATGRTQYVDHNVLATLPPSESGEIDVYFVPTRKYVPVNEADAFIAQFGLVFSPRGQAAANEDDPGLADTVPSGTQWGGNCYLTFYRWRDERSVDCCRNDNDWHDFWFLSGVPAPRK